MSFLRDYLEYPCTFCDWVQRHCYLILFHTNYKSEFVRILKLKTTKLTLLLAFVLCEHKNYTCGSYVFVNCV
jgi:hypothetical protein